MPNSIYDFERLSEISTQDSTRWDILSSTIANVKYSVPVSDVITVTSANVADLPGLAATYLGSRYLWYTLLHYNGLYDSTEDIVPGMTLNIPDKHLLITYLKGKNKKLGVQLNNIIL
jgi:hypothetical protein